MVRPRWRCHAVDVRARWCVRGRGHGHDEVRRWRGAEARQGLVRRWQWLVQVPARCASDMGKWCAVLLAESSKELATCVCVHGHVHMFTSARKQTPGRGSCGSALLRSWATSGGGPVSPCMTCPCECTICVCDGDWPHDSRRWPPVRHRDPCKKARRHQGQDRHG